jgi:hypothetical protein
MGADGVFPAEMPEHGLFLAGPLDDDTAERLVAGRVGPDDAPPGYAGVASVLQAAAGPAEPEELAGREAALAIFRTHGPAMSRGRPAGVGRGRPAGVGRGRPDGVGRGRARVVALALAGVMAAGGLWMAGGARTVPGLRSPTGGAGAGGAGSGTPGLVTQARPLTPPVSGAGANARAPVPFSSHDRSTRPGGGTASRASPHGSKEHRPGKPPKPKPPKPKPAEPKPEQPKPGGKPKHQR